MSSEPWSQSKKRGADEPTEELSPSHSKRVHLTQEDTQPIASRSSIDSSKEPLAAFIEENLVEDADTKIDVEEGSTSTAGANRNGTSQPAKGKRKEQKSGRGRGGRRTRNDEDANREPELGPDGQPIPKAPRLPKRQCALLLGFCGSGYSGMQIQPDHTRTIEGVLFNALVKVGAVSQDNADNPVKVSLARAARTDAGVHAAGNLVSLKMIMTIPGVKDLVGRINEELPPEIRLWGYCRVQNSFNARLICESRKYTYFFPTYLLIPPKPGSNFANIWAKHVGVDVASKPHLFWENNYSGSTEEDMARKRAWRISPDQVESLRTLAERYHGTHNFHNFTVGRDFGDRSNYRYMKKIEIADPVVYGGTEWISVLFHGQSFMLHQANCSWNLDYICQLSKLTIARTIQRKMMAVLVLACRMGTPSRIMSELYGQRDVFVPKMPALGLLLEEPLYGSYNQRMAAISEKLQPTDAEYRPTIDFEPYREQINAFKEEFIYKNMREVEDRDGLFDAWIRSIDTYAGNDLLYLNPTGAVPDEAVIVKGAKRNNPFREKKIFDTTSFTNHTEIKQKLEEDGEVEEDEVIDKRNLEETEG